MRYFPKDCDAVVLHADSHAPDRFGDSYALYLEGCGYVAWYPGEALRLIRSGAWDILEQWREGLRKIDDAMHRACLPDVVPFTVRTALPPG